MLRVPPVTARGFRLITAAFLAASLAGCEPNQQDADANGAASQPKQALPLPKAIPTPDPPLSREQLLQAVAIAASAVATGADDRQVQERLSGKRFIFKIRFGCEGPSARLAAAPLGWRLDEAGGSLTVRARPDLDAEDLAPEETEEPANAEGEEENAAAAAQGVKIEAVEGFWIPRPWILTDACPAAAPPPSGSEGAAEGLAEAAADAPDSAAAPLPYVGIAQYFTGQDSRVQRRSGRSYQSVTKIAAGEPAPASGFNLVLEGRLRPWPEGKAIRCENAGPEARPRCVISAEFDRVAVENPQTGAELANWSSG